ncbi:hypothetical protein SMACR_12804 [Sordaria macrospora]|uniref:WGS project CABT00000000 data, contig 2.6 n=2 Tax=Sordaria macrospora TaxID=5147 RepID=F7VSM2_SORMK|nr:uncharacterized protein SMAC_12804 [Sordaria macrospora k-hell]KAA8630192.1 hypothetical protein SMACR_12804 [Sordaria macrospora]WPJ57684.1 hypothetical protein SMAC4_12804 [Sordaria macrospora]CCC08689.1 unnamed protein product [Sordaria macrospora k-hell]
MMNTPLQHAIIRLYVPSPKARSYEDLNPVAYINSPHPLPKHYLALKQTLF